jgi:hypothetical protein
MGCFAFGHFGMPLHEKRGCVGNTSRCWRRDAGRGRTDRVCRRRSESANKESAIGNSAYSSDRVDGVLCVCGLFSSLFFTLLQLSRTTKFNTRSNPRCNVKNSIYLSLSLSRLRRSSCACSNQRTLGAHAHTRTAITIQQIPRTRTPPAAILRIAARSTVVHATLNFRVLQVARYLWAHPAPPWSRMPPAPLALPDSPPPVLHSRQTIVCLAMRTPSRPPPPLPAATSSMGPHSGAPTMSLRVFRHQL